MCGNWHWGMGFGWIFVVLFWVLVISGIIHFARKRGCMGGPYHHGETALDILKKRYARGEISQEDFERMKKELSE